MVTSTLVATVGVAAALASPHTLLHSRELWATIDVCNPPDQRYTVGVRGSMPGDGNSRDHMYMSFRLQYKSATGSWVDVAAGASSGWELVGNGGPPRQGGSSFTLGSVSANRAVTLRGVVDFQWRRGKTVLLSTAAPTSTGRKSLAGADPAGYSAANCAIG